MIDVACTTPSFRDPAKRRMSSQFTPGKDSCRIVTDAPALALKVGQDPFSLPLLDGLDLKLGQFIASEGAGDQKRQHDAVALAFQATLQLGRSRQGRSTLCR